MIHILIVDDNPNKQDRIKQTIIDNHDTQEVDISQSYSIKAARKFLYDNECDLLILDLVLPVEDNGECEAKNSIQFLKEMEINPSIKPPIHIVGLSSYKDEVIEHNEEFRRKLWNLIEYEESSTSWQEQLNSIIYHLVKTRKKFLGAPIEKQLNFYLAEIEEKNFPNTFLGMSWNSIGQNLSSIVERALEVPSKFSNGSKAKNINSSSIRISSEYDFQNLIHMTLRPWIPSTEPENIAIIFDGNTKNADFSIKGNSIIIEAKYIDSTGKKNDTLKTLEGLKHFYRMNANIRLLLFFILVDKNVELDKHKIESEYSIITQEPIIYVKIFENNLI